jgi:hypothetical protein
MAKLRGSKNDKLEFYASEIEKALKLKEEYPDLFFISYLKSIIKCMKNEIKKTKYQPKSKIKSL